MVAGGYNIWLAVQFQSGAAGDFGWEESVELLHRLLIVCGGAAAFTLLKCFSLHCYWNIHRFSLSCTAVFFFSPSSECRIERLEFPKIQSYSAYDIKLKSGHQNITDNVQSYNEYTYSMATCYMYIYMLTHFMGQI